MKQKLAIIFTPIIMVVAIVVVISRWKACYMPKCNFDTDKITISRWEDDELVTIQEITDQDEVAKVTKMLKEADLSKCIPSIQAIDSPYLYWVTINSKTVIGMKTNWLHGCISDGSGREAAIYLPKDFCEYIKTIVQKHKE